MKARYLKAGNKYYWINHPLFPLKFLPVDFFAIQLLNKEGITFVRETLLMEAMLLDMHC